MNFEKSYKKTNNFIYLFKKVLFLIYVSFEKWLISFSFQHMTTFVLLSLLLSFFPSLFSFLFCFSFFFENHIHIKHCKTPTLLAGKQDFAVNIRVHCDKINKRAFELSDRSPREI